MVAPKILVVEDEFLIRMTLSEALGDAGFTVMEAEDGPAALIMMEADPPALLLTDLSLPGGMDGVTLAARARAICPELAVIFMTGRTDLIPPGAASSPRDVVVGKPYHIAELCAHAQRLIGRSG
jgi:DNA-binding response OmpR family regulator